MGKAGHDALLDGAKCAGLVTGFVARGQTFPSTMATPDVIGQSLADVASRIAAMPAA